MGKPGKSGDSKGKGGESKGGVSKGASKGGKPEKGRSNAFYRWEIRDWLEENGDQIYQDIFDYLWEHDGSAGGADWRDNMVTKGNRYLSERCPHLFHDFLVAKWIPIADVAQPAYFAEDLREAMVARGLEDMMDNMQLERQRDYSSDELEYPD
jgi:hypothetical protein